MWFRTQTETIERGVLDLKDLELWSYDVTVAYKSVEMNSDAYFPFFKQPTKPETCIDEIQLSNKKNKILKHFLLFALHINLTLSTYHNSCESDNYNICKYINLLIANIIVSADKHFTVWMNML